jgi:signal transduction histidine kinase
MSGAAIADAGESLGEVNSSCDRYSKRSREEYRARRESGGSPQKPNKAKSRRPLIAERALGDHAGPARLSLNAASGGLPNGYSGSSDEMASSAAENCLSALELGAIQDAVRQERQRIARDLHDHAGQYLIGIAFRLAAIEQAIADPSTNHAFAELRQLLDRFCHELRAISRGEHLGLPFGCDLATALANMAFQWERETGIAVRFHSEQTGNGIEPDGAISEAMYRIAQEALTNIAKHATKASHVMVRLEFAPELLRLTIADDGPGLESCRETGRPVRRGGIINMQERLAERGGQLVIFCPPAGGTTVVATMPMERHRNP